MQHIIAVDIGTQSLRAVIFAARGHILTSVSHSYTPTFYTGNWVEQDPSDWKDALAKALFSLGAYLAENSLQVEALCLTSQRASVIPVDEGGNPLHPALMWQDKRAVKQCEYIARHIAPEELYRQCGLRLDPYFSLPKMLYFKQERPAVWRKIYKLLGVQDYINYLLTGNYTTDWSQACRTMLLCIDDFSWNMPLLDKLGFEKHLLCDLCPPGSISGYLRDEFARQVGLPVGLPILLGGGDQQCAALALGLLSPRSITANTGTGSFVLGYVDKPTFDARQRLLCSGAAIPGRWLVEAGIYASGASYNWCKNNFFPDQADSFGAINAEVEKIPPGSRGVLVLPHFQGSAAPNWNPRAKGLFFNLTLGTTRGEMCRAVLEGIAMEIADNVDIIEENIGGVDRVYLAGGLTNFPTYCQILADVLGREVERRKNSEASLGGCLMSAGVTLGWYRDYESAYSTIVKYGEEKFDPIEKNIPLYQQKRKVKAALYEALNGAGIYGMVE